MKHSEQLNELAKAMSQLQSEIKDAEKDNQGYGYKYADLGNVLGLIRPLLAKNGLSFVQHPSSADGHVSVETIIMHSSGQWMSSVLTMPLVVSKSMNAAQAVGSILSYARRYSLTSLFSVAQIDHDTNDDGSADKGHVAAPAAKAPAKPSPLTEKEIEIMGTLIFEAGADIQKFMEAYRVNKFSELTRPQYEDAISKLHKKIKSSKGVVK